MDNYIISEITIDYIFKKFRSIDQEQSVPRTITSGNNNSCCMPGHSVVQRELG